MGIHVSSRNNHCCYLKTLSSIYKSLKPVSYKLDKNKVYKVFCRHRNVCSLSENYSLMLQNITLHYMMAEAYAYNTLKSTLNYCKMSRKKIDQDKPKTKILTYRYHRSNLWIIWVYFQTA